MRTNSNTTTEPGFARKGNLSGYAEATGLRNSGQLEPAHGFAAAEDLLASLRGVDELADYVLPEVWLENSQHNSIAALCAREPVCVVVGRAENSLPSGGQQKQGGLIRVGVAVYVFQVNENVKPEHRELRERVLMTVVKYCNRWRYQPQPDGEHIAAHLMSLGEVDLSGVNKDFAANVSADSLLLEVPLRLTID